MMDLFRSSKVTHAAGKKGRASRLRRRQTGPPGRRTVTTAERIGRYIGKIPGAVSGNGGHSQTFKVAMVLFNGFGCSEAETLEWLRHYNSKCEPPWSEAELRHKARSATEAAYDKPRGWMLTSKRFSRVRLQVPVFPGKSCPVSGHGCHGSFPLPTQLRGDSYTHKKTPPYQRESQKVPWLTWPRPVMHRETMTLQTPLCRPSQSSRIRPRTAPISMRPAVSQTNFSSCTAMVRSRDRRMRHFSPA